MAQKTEMKRETERQRGALERSPERHRGLWRRDPFETAFGPSGFGSVMRRMQEDMDRLFDSFGMERFGLSPRSSGDWAPAIDVFQRGNEFVVRADVPGLSREDLTVEIGDETLTISGERKYDREEEREGVYRSERAYGSFTRVVPLPEGVVADSAKANFRNGVLEIVMQAPSHEVRRGRQVEIKEGSGERSENR
jgi:HSP20 family protein